MWRDVSTVKIILLKSGEIITIDLAYHTIHELGNDLVEIRSNFNINYYKQYNRKDIEVVFNNTDELEKYLQLKKARKQEKEKRASIPVPERAQSIVKEYIVDHLDKSDKKVDFDTYIVWSVKVLQNWKFLISSSLLDGMYYEVTYNGDKQEFYLDAYKKFENKCIEY